MLVMDTAIHLWIAMMGVLCVAGASSDFVADPDGEDDAMVLVKRVAFAVGGLACIVLIGAKAVTDWGMVAIASVAVLLCGAAVTLVCLALSYIERYDWMYVVNSFAGMLTAVGVALAACCLIFPTAQGLEFEEYSYGTETRILEPVQDGLTDHLVRQRSDGLYGFRFERKDYDPAGTVRRGILDADHVVLLEDSSAEPAHVDGEVLAMAKLDPISGHPIELQSGKVFVPTVLYVHPSDVGTNRASANG